jgi:glutathione peroxidase
MTSTIDAIPVNKIDGTPATLADWAGDVRLVVNVASKCGLTPQYQGLEKLYGAYRDKGLTILGFPANNFGGQEPGTNEEVASFCTATYGVTFPMFQKISVRGDDQHPLYTALTAAQPKASAKDDSFLVDRDGRVVGRFAPDVTAEDALLVDAIKAAL